MNAYTKETIESWQKMPHVYVLVDKQKLREDAIREATKNKELPRWDVPGVHPKDHQAFVRHVFWWNVVNFAFSYFDRLSPDGSLVKFKTKTVAGQEVQGAFAMAACFYRAFGEKLIFARDMWPYVERRERLAEFFSGESEISMLSERLDLLREACRELERYFSGDPWNIWLAGNFFAYGSDKKPGIVDLLIKYFPNAFGQDTWQYYTREETLRFHFHKRARLAVLMYHDRAEYYPDELPVIKDIQELGSITDYELPNAYVGDGIFWYSTLLEEFIGRPRLIPAGSNMELEVRGATEYAQDLELSIWNEERARKGMKLYHRGHADYYRWQMGKRYNARKHHLCKTTAY